MTLSYVLEPIRRNPRGPIYYRYLIRNEDVNTIMYPTHDKLIFCNHSLIVLSDDRTAHINMYL